MWDFIQDEVFGMKWLNRLIGSLLNACDLDTESKLGGSLQFFIYDTIKIMVLLGFLIFVIADWRSCDLCRDERLNVFDLCLMKRKLVNDIMNSSLVTAN